MKVLFPLERKAFYRGDKIRVAAYQVVSSLGIGRDETAASLRKGRTKLTFDHPLSEYSGCPVGAVSCELPCLPSSLADYDTRCNRLALACLDLLSEDIRLLKDRHPANRIGVTAATTSSGFFDLEQTLSKGLIAGESRYAATIPFGSVASFISSALGIRGPSLTCSTACSSSANAIMTARNMIRAGLCDAVVAGGFEALCKTTLMGFKSLRVVDPNPCRPFDESRAGMNLGEGAAVLLLERVDGNEVDSPGTYIAGAGASVDAYHMTSPEPEGKGAETAMRAALKDAGIGPGRISYINLHGTGTVLNDAAEAAALARVFRNEMPACSSTKGMSGHMLGSASAFELCVAMTALDSGFAPANVGLETYDPNLQVRPLRNVAPIPKGGYAMSNSFGFGGNNTSIIVHRCMP